MTPENQVISKIGVLGAGQLGALLTQSLQRANCQVVVYAQSNDEPACQLADKCIIGERSDKQKLKSFFSSCKTVVLESEFYNPQILKELKLSSGTNVFPALENYEKLFSKEKQKKFFNENNIANVAYHLVRSEKDLEQLEFDGPYMVKVSHGGYDGKGNFFIDSKQELIKKALTLSSSFSKELLVEKFIKIKEEFAVMLIKNARSQVVLPPCKTVQKDAVCHLVRYPFDCESSVQSQIQEIMYKISKALPGEGIYAYEFFLTEELQVLVNEAAPRVHNSYHFSIEAFDQSQFDLCRDAILDRELKNPEAKVPFACMVNILGTETRDHYVLEFNERALEYPFKVHMYGKTKMTKGRKMGHITFYGERDSFAYAQEVSEEYRL